MPGLEDVLAGSGDVAGVSTDTLIQLIERCHGYFAVYGAYRILEVFKHAYPRVPVDVLHAVIGVDLYCRRPKESDEKILANVGMEPTGAKTFTDMKRELDAQLHGAEGVDPRTHANIREANVKQD